MDIERVKGFFRQDRFVQALGIEIKSADAGTCECTAEIVEQHLNAGNVVQGGMIFTIADFTFAVAANCKHGNVVSLNNNITYVRPPKMCIRDRMLAIPTSNVGCSRDMCSCIPSA